ncbi:MAG: LptF/LptG family permease [Planctomycetota bacterium]|nr:MAG: LptF/LptG family permease [Planctomycetota bacterium]REJ87093.1 MAG: LptF/LptG family permease [Planctomycetota bacterium]
MLTIDRYLLRQFLWLFCIFVCSFTGLYIIADSVNNFEELSSFAEENGGLLRVILVYYGARSLAFFDQVSAILVLITALFTIAAFRRHNEMTALMAAGIRKARIVRPVIMVGIAFCLFATINREFIIPSMIDKLSYNAQDLSADHQRKVTPRYDNETRVFIMAEGAILREKRLVRPTFHMPIGPLQRYGTQFSAATASHLPADGQRPTGFLLDGVAEADDLRGKPSLTIGDKPVVITPRDATWLEHDQCFVATGVDIERLTGGTHWRQYASVFQLIGGLRNASNDYGSDVRVEIHSRIVRPLLDVTLLFLGIPLVLTRESRNMLLAVGNCVVLVALFLVVVMATEYLGSHLSLSPALAAWCPLMIFVPISAMTVQPLLE